MHTHVPTHRVEIARLGRPGVCGGKCLDTHLHEPNVLRLGMVEQVRVAQQHQSGWFPFRRRLCVRVCISTYD